MTIRFTQSWNGYYTGQVVTSPAGGNTEAQLVALGYADYDLDGPGNQINPALSSRDLSSLDVDTVVQCNSASAVVLTIPTDAVGGFTGPVAIGLYQAGAGAASFAAGGGVTLRGTAPTIAQYGSMGIWRVGPNEWAYL